MSWKRPNIGSRMNREVHIRFWERLEVKLLRATRQRRRYRPRSRRVRSHPDSGRAEQVPPLPLRARFASEARHRLSATNSVISARAALALIAAPAVHEALTS